MNKRIIIWLLVFLISFSAFAQKEGCYWYFGHQSGIQFLANGGDPIPKLGSKMSTNEGCATIADSEGNLLFYTDGITVYDRSHAAMSGGTGLYGHASSTQSGVIVPVPNRPEIYYVFTVSALSAKEAKGFHYSIVNLTEGLGSVVDKNILLFSETTERITAVKHTNDFGIWVIGHECNTNRFYSYLVTPSGVDPNVVTSDVGIVHTCNSTSDNTGKGYMKASPTFSKLAVAIESMGIIQLFDFDRSTGVLSNPIDIFHGPEVYGVEFSENSFYLYGTARDGIDITQWDLQSGNADSINASKITIGTLTESSTGALQIAPNGKIYMAVKNKPYLSAINEPTIAGLACDFDEKSIVWDINAHGSKHYGVWGLPTFIQSFFKTFWFIVENECVGDEIIFTLNSLENLDMVEWDFGDPESGPNDTSTLFNPVHIYSEPGEYTVMAKFHYLNTVQSYSKKISIFEAPDIELGNDTIICEGDTASYHVSDLYGTYCWNGNICTDPFYKTMDEGNIHLEVTNVCGTDMDDVFVTLQADPLCDLGCDLEMKYNEYISLDAGSHDQYLWSDGSVDRYLYPELPGMYWVEIQDVIGCKSSDTLEVSPIPFSFHVPTAFSPNGDEINENFRIYTSYEVPTDFEYEFFVFNRWGQQIFHALNYGDFWDGTFNNLPCPTEVYTWVLIVKMEEDNEFFTKSTQLAGTVTLLR